MSLTLAFVSLVCIVWGVVWTARCLCAALDVAASVCNVAVLAVAATVVPLAVLGTMGLLNRPTALVAYLALGVTASGICRWTGRGPRPFARPTITGLDVISAIAIFALLATSLIKVGLGPFRGDDVSYHLYYPAQWVQDGAVSPVPAPFSQCDTSYYPCNTELLYALMLLVTRADFLLAYVSMLAIALCLFGTIELGRSMGFSRAGASLAALGFLLVRRVWSQAGTAHVELLLCCWLLCAVLSTIRLIDTPKLGSAVMAACSIGLLAGTKYLGAVFAIPLAIVGVLTVLRHRRPMWLVPYAMASIVCGGGWYVRNLLVCGNPLYPLDCSIFGWSIFTGPASLDRLRDAVPRTQGLVGIAKLFWDDLGPVVNVLAYSSAAAWAGWLCSAKGRRANVALVAGQAAWTVFVFLFLVPQNTETRYLIPTFPLLFLAWCPILERIPPAWRRIAATGLALAGLAWFLAERWRHFTPIVESGLLAGTRLWTVALLVASAGLGVVLLVVPVASGSRRPRLLKWVSVGLCSAGAFYWGHELSSKCRYDGWLSKMGAVPPWHEALWQALDQPDRELIIACTGDEILYPLCGSRLQNRVFACPAPPVSRTEDERVFASWAASLRRKKATHLVIYWVPPMLRRFVPADADGFPPVAKWVAQDPHAFSCVFSSPGAKAYEVR